MTMIADLPDRISSYGVSLTRLTAADLELVRHWRNHPSVAQYMEYREHITPAMQQAWFARIDNPFNSYMLVEWNGRKVALTNLKNIDYTAHCAEGGIFFWDPECLNSDVPFRQHFAAYDWYFANLPLEIIHVHILRDNRRAIRFNTLLGCVLQPGQEQVRNQLFHLTREAHASAHERFAHLLTD